METQKRIIELIAEINGYGGEDIGLNYNLVLDLGYDSLDRAELLMALEQEFGFELSDDEAMQVATVQQVIDKVKESITVH